MKKLIAVLVLALASQALAGPSQPKKVLVILSSENKITLRDGVVHPTGYFLSEMMVPVMALEKAGYEPVFANPQGNQPTMDVVSDSNFWFGGNDLKYQETKRQFTLQKGFNHPLTLKNVRALGLDQFAAVFLPGGHAPMEDLLKDRDLGAILKYFHRAQKPTALICHAPISLLSTLDNPEVYENALSKRSALEAEGESLRVSGKSNPGQLKEIYKAIATTEVELSTLSQNWIYKNYKLTGFSTKEEKQEELTGQDNMLGGFVQFYVDEALGFAGGRAVSNAVKWTSNVQVDHELITGQNPFSDEDLARELVKSLN